MQTIDNTQQPDFVSQFSLQRQRLLHHAGAILTPGASQSDPGALAAVTQMLMTSLELLKVAEDELREERRTNDFSRAAQERRLAYLTGLFDLAPTPLVLTTSDSTIREVNGAAARLFGRDGNALSGKQLCDMVPKDQRAAFKDQLTHARDMGSVAAWSFRLDLQRSLPVVVSASVDAVEDPRIGSRALYWSIRVMGA